MNYSISNKIGRRRRVKCGEEKQTCTNCKKSHFECIWSNDKPTHDDGKVRKLSLKNGNDFVFYRPSVTSLIQKSRQDPKCDANLTTTKPSLIGMVNDLVNFDCYKQPHTGRQSSEHLMLIVEGFDFQLSVFSGLDSLRNSPKIPPIGDNEEFYGSVSLRFRESLTMLSELAYNLDSQDEELSPSREGLEIMAVPPSPKSGIEAQDMLRNEFRIEEVFDDDNESPEVQIEPRAQTQCLQSQNFSQHLSLLHSGQSRLMYAFINGFIDAISPQYCHPKLTPRAIFIGQGPKHEIMQEVFRACGAAFMSNIDSIYTIDSRKKYSLCLANIADELSKEKEPKEWMVAAMLLFCLRDKVVGAPPVQAAMHLAKAIDLIRDLLKGQNYDIQNIKFMAESFLFNYAVLLLVGGKDTMDILPSPFVIFEEWRRLIDMQIYPGSVPWMNNPVFGAAGRAFELAAKVSWLVIKQPLTNVDIVVACDLLIESAQIHDFANFEPPPTLSNENKQQLKDSVYISKTIVACSKIVLYKLLNPLLDVNNPSIKNLTSEAHGFLAEILVLSRVNVIVSWGILILGLCTVDPQRRLELSTRCEVTCMTHHVAFLGQVGCFLNKIWDSSKFKDNGDLDCLFDQETLGKMCL